MAETTAKRGCEKHVPLKRYGRIVAFHVEGELSAFAGPLPEPISRLDELPLYICRCGVVFVPEWLLEKLGLEE